MDYLRFILAAVTHSPTLQALEVLALLLLTTFAFYRYNKHLPITSGQYWTNGRVVYNGEEDVGRRFQKRVRSVYVMYNIDGKPYQRQWARKLQTNREKALRDKDAGSSLKVFYSPCNPSEAYLNSPPSKQELFRSMFRRTVVNWMLIGNLLGFLPWYFNV